MTRTVQQVLDAQAAQAAADREPDAVGTDVVPSNSGGGDGFGVREKPTGLIRGTSFRFVDGRFVYTSNRAELPPARLIATGMITAWQRWQLRELVEIRITPDGSFHPSREQLPDDDPTLWPVGQDGKAVDVWADARYLFLVDPATAAEFTFLTSTIGGRIGCTQLKNQIQSVRRMRERAVPLVTFASATMNTKHGPKPRPRFDVVEWRNVGEATVPTIEPAADWGRAPEEIPF
jgi:hypothetical protein